MVKTLLQKIESLGDKKKAVWWENYVKHGSHFLGVPMNTLRTELKQWYKQQSNMFYEEQKAAVQIFFQGYYAEEQLLGILMMSEHMKDVSDKEMLDLIETVIHEVSDWNICDWLCVKVIGPRLDKNDFSERLKIWSHSDDLWHRRAALVPFVRVDHRAYLDVILEIASALLKRPERFSKTAVGWVLREMMPSHRNEVVNFLCDHKAFLINEVLNNALKHETDKKTLKKAIMA